MKSIFIFIIGIEDVTSSLVFITSIQDIALSVVFQLVQGTIKIINFIMILILSLAYERIYFESKITQWLIFVECELNNKIISFNTLQ